MPAHSPASCPLLYPTSHPSHHGHLSSLAGTCSAARFFGGRPHPRMAAPWHMQWVKWSGEEGGSLLPTLIQVRSSSILNRDPEECASCTGLYNCVTSLTNNIHSFLFIERYSGLSPLSPIVGRFCAAGITGKYFFLRASAGPTW